MIALLMDGPQLKERWSARHATTLADDPGSSVLCVTSLGMAELSRGGGNTAVGSRVVALWKEAKTAQAQEITMPPGMEAVVLSLSMKRLEEWTADCRSDHHLAVAPMLSGIHFVTRAAAPAVR